MVGYRKNALNGPLELGEYSKHESLLALQEEEYLQRNMLAVMILERGTHT